MPRINKTQQSKLTLKNKVWRVGVYIRLSKEDGNDVSESVTNQRKIINDYLKNQFEDKFELIDNYIDDGVSGTTDYGRPEFQRMVYDIERGAVDAVICKSLSRAFRNGADQANFLRDFCPRRQVRFIAINDNLDTHLQPNRVYEFDVSIMGTFNESYPYMISKEIHKTFKMKRDRGEFIGAFAPYGYAKDPNNKNRFIIDEEAAEVVKRIYKWYVEDGMSQLGIVKHLNGLGILPPSKYKHRNGMKYASPKITKPSGLWAVSTICRILRNQTYIGRMVQGTQRVVSHIVHDKVAIPKEDWIIIEDMHEPIISKVVFDKAQELHSRNTRTAPKERKVSLFSGFLKCADCRMGMHRKTCQKGGKVYTYYACSTYILRHKESCSLHSVKGELLEIIVLKAIQEQVKLIGSLNKIVDEIRNKPVSSKQTDYLSKQHQTHLTELDKLRSISDELYSDWKMDIITKDDYFRMKKDFESKIDNLVQIISSVENEIEERSNGLNSISPYLETFLNHQTIPKLTRSLLVELVDSIQIHENKEITINFRFADKHQQILDLIEENTK